MKSLKDDRGYNQIWVPKESTKIRAARRCDWLIEQMVFEKDKSIMEIGCGLGSNAFLMAQKTGMQVLGTDLCVPFIEQAKHDYQLPNLSYDILDFNKAESFEGKKFDYIVGNGILHHLYYGLDKALVNIKKLLKENGKIIFMEPNLYNPYIYFIFSYPKLRKLASLEPDEMAFTKGFITKKLSNAGYKNIQVSYKDFLLPGIPEILIKPSIVIGDVVEKIPLLNKISQSIFIVAE